MADQKRPYRKKRRAELEAQTRRRITEATVELHGTIGPASTSFSAVAKQAGVRRSTLYRHFPDETALFAACSAHWMAANPRPDLDSWAAIADPDERLAHALAELYAYYGRTAPMLSNLLRDEDTVAVVKHQFRGFHSYLAAARDVLVQGRPARGRAHKRVSAVIGHALALHTWRSFTSEEGLTVPEAVDVMCRAVAAQEAGRAPSPQLVSRRG